MRKIQTLFFTLLNTFILAQTPSSQWSPPLSVGVPEEVGMSSERLARIDSMCEAVISENQVPGMVALVARKGKIVYHKAFGTADAQTGRAFHKDDIFRIASQTKAITATAVMMLWEEGRFRLDDPISKWIPEFKEMEVLEDFDEADTSYTTVPAENEITIRHLLTHTSGIGYGQIDSDPRFRKIFEKAGIIDAFTTENISIEENVKKLAELPLHFHPGEGYAYGEGLDVLGYFVEILSGMPFDQFLKERLFDPLGMKDTWFYLPEELESQLVPVQVKSEDGKWSRFPGHWFDPGYPVQGAKRFFSGGAGLSSTAKDYAQFIQMYLNGGELNGRRFLSRTTVDLIMRDHISGHWGEDPDSYLGLAYSVVTSKGERKGGMGSEGTFGWGGYFNTQYFGDPGEQIIGIIMKQVSGVSDDTTQWKFKILVSQAIDD